MTPASSRSQRALTVIGFLAAAGLTAGAFVLSYDALRLLALAGLEGDNADRFGRYYPVVYDGLVALALLSVFVARDSAWWVRWVRWLVLLALVAGGIAASVRHALGGFEPIRGTALEAGVASAPWVIALLAVWLWMSMLRQLREGAVRRRAWRRPGRHRPSRARRPDEAPEPVPVPVETGAADRPEDQAEDRSEHQTDPLPLPTAEDLAEAYREAGPEPGPGDSPRPDAAHEVYEAHDAHEVREAHETLPDPPTREEPPARPPLTLPTDVKLVGRKEEHPVPEHPEPERQEKAPEEPDVDVLASTTMPDFPLPGGRGPEEQRAEEDRPAAEADTREDDWASYSPELNPPSGTLRSGPLPPGRD